ncbi:MAG: S8 family peptidase [Anderseniella sp.]
MPNNPVQIVLNHSDFLRAPDPMQGGGGKDFFSDADAAFDLHKRELLASIDRIIKEIEASSYGPAAYLKVQMRNEALAKSYRPVKFLFHPDRFPCVGAEAVGTIFFRAPLIYLDELRRRIDAAEATVAVNISKNTGKPYKAPTPARSEVGAIETIEIAPPANKRNFSTAAAMQLFDDPRTVSGYQVELFETPGDNVIADDPLGRFALLSSLQDMLLGLGTGARTLFASEIGRTPVLEFQLTNSSANASVDNRLGIAGRDVTPLSAPAPVDLNPDRHEAVLNKLVDHPLVRSIQPPVQLQLADDETSPSDSGSPRIPAATLAIPFPSVDATYPIVGVIDSGVAPILEAWVEDRFDYLDETEYNPTHGTGVAGLISSGQLANDTVVVPEPDGCKIYDAPLYPTGPFMDKYANGFSDFLEELEQAVAEASQQYRVRVFNLSINAISDVERHRYSIYAARLDQIADNYGVIFVNSSGNLPLSQARTPWQKKPIDVVRYFASRTQPDTIYKPSESVRSISVGALNPPETGQIERAPTVYTTRGPGLQVGVKPDVATYGGAGAVGPGKTTGLASITPSGEKKSVVGTSYAAPLVARTLAGLDTSTQGGLQTEALRAMLLHHTQMPEPLAKRGLKELGRQFAGFGQPGSVLDMLETDDHQITLLFQSRLSIGERKPAILRFPFDWPRSLVDSDGSCSGRARMTLVYSPPLDPAFGAEFVRVNLEASLRQRQPKIKQDGGASYTNQIAARYLPKTAGLGVPEKALIDHGLKWWPSKQYESTFTNKGEFSNWRLEVSSLVRAEASFPAEGVPFSVLLTIEDPERQSPVFSEMRLALQASNAVAQDIRTATRVRPRG